MGYTTEDVSTITEKYKCDQCDYVGYKPKDMVQHEWITHKTATEKEVIGHKWFYITCQEQFDAIVADQGSYRVFYAKFYGEDWYRFWDTRQRCPRGCCYDEVINSETPYSTIAEKKEVITTAIQELRALRRAFKKPE